MNDPSHDLSREVQRSTALAHTRDARTQLTWVPDRGLVKLDQASPAGAAVLSLLTGGGGQLLVRDFKRGAAFIAVMFVLLVFFPAGGLLFGLGTGVLAWRQATQINTFLAQQRASQAADTTGSPLLALARARDQGRALPPGGAPAPAPARDPLADVTPEAARAYERLRKARVLCNRAMIDTTELASRKLDVLTELIELHDDHHDLLYELLALRDEGTLDDADIEFARSILVV